MFVIILVVSVANLIAASPAESHHHRHKHLKHHKKAHDSESSPEFNKRTSLPPNIWALLASNKRSSDDDDLGSKYNADISPNHDANEIAENSSDSEPSDDESIKKVAANCPKCKQNSVKMSENELANLRIEYVKNQILHKLRMTERPAPISKDAIPEPLQEGYAIGQGDEQGTAYLNRHLDDYFAKTTQKIIFLTRGEFWKFYEIEMKINKNLFHRNRKM